MRNRKSPRRRCVVCRRVLPRESLFRLAKTNNIQIDFRYNHPGRGAYVCARETCLKGFLKGMSMTPEDRDLFMTHLISDLSARVLSCMDRYEIADTKDIQKGDIILINNDVGVLEKKGIEEEALSWGLLVFWMGDSIMKGRQRCVLDARRCSSLSRDLGFIKSLSCKGLET
ncbi:MAG: YlxR family protein [Thermodesulfobacteriota bacterium]|nr:YlxR family protein [Thermodesulfobacteriota bacterium]